MKIEREDQGSGNSFIRRHRSRDGYLADFPVSSGDYFAVEEDIIPNIEPMLAMVGAQSSTPRRRLEDSTAHCVRSCRHGRSAAYRGGAEDIPGRPVIQLNATNNATAESEMAPRIANVGLPEGGSRHRFRRCLSADCTHHPKRESTS